MRKNGFTTTFVVCLMFFVLVFSGCTAKQRAKKFGGIATIDLPAGKKLVTATWKEKSIWYLVRNQRPGEEPEEYQFHEDSQYGLMEGTVIFVEH